MDWPNRWKSGIEHMNEDEDTEMVNDHGILYLIGDTSGSTEEWLKMYGEVPENNC